jgi:hypothetical protein
MILPREVSAGKNLKNLDAFFVPKDSRFLSLQTLGRKTSNPFQHKKPHPSRRGMGFSLFTGDGLFRLRFESQNRLFAGSFASLEKLRLEGCAHFDLLWLFGIDPGNAGDDLYAFPQFYDAHNIGVISPEAFFGHGRWSYNDAGKSLQFPIPFELHPFHLAPEAGYAYRPGG